MEKEIHIETSDGLPYDYTLKEFKVWVQTRYKIEGLVTFYYCNQELTDLYKILGNIILNKKEALYIHYDKKISVAVGGYGGGAWAQAAPGGQAVAGGGYGTGGVFDGNGTFTGGKGLGGDGRGIKGKAGEGQGGVAFAIKGKVGNGGRGVGGEFADM